jgi:hypothetical protein
MSEVASTFATELGHEHLSLLGLLDRLEEKVEPASAGCAGLLVGLLKEVQATLQRHFRFEEQGGYMSYIMAEDAPYLYRAAQELLLEHGRLSDGLESLIASAAGVAPESSVPTTLQEQVRHWVRLVRDHEARENRLIHQACNQEIGADD